MQLCTRLLQIRKLMWSPGDADLKDLAGSRLYQVRIQTEGPHLMQPATYAELIIAHFSTDTLEED